MLRAAGAPAEYVLNVHAPHGHEEAYAATHHMLQTCEAPRTAIFTVSLIATAGAEGAGYRIPTNVSILALYDLPFAGALLPAVTPMRVRRMDVGRIAVNFLIDLLQGRRPSGALMLAPGGQITRMSTAPRPPASSGGRTSRFSST